MYVLVFFFIGEISISSERRQISASDRTAHTEHCQKNVEQFFNIYLVFRPQYMYESKVI
jgi:hypothetical protein